MRRLLLLLGCAIATVLAGCRRAGEPRASSSPGSTPPTETPALSSSPVLRVVESAADSDSIRVIRERYALIQRDTLKYPARTRGMDDFSTQGGELTAYYQGGALRKIVALFLGEGGRATQEYYFWDGRLFFSLVTTQYYGRSIYDAPSTRRGRKYIAEDRFYFAGGKLIRWVDSTGKTVPAVLAEGRGQAVQAEADQFSRCASPWPPRGNQSKFSYRKYHLSFDIKGKFHER